MFVLKVLIFVVLSCVIEISGQCLKMPGISCNPEDVKFYLYPNPRNYEDYDELIHGNLQTIYSSRYNANKNLIVIVHGFTQTFKSKLPTIVKNAYLESGFASTTNIVAVDYGRLSGAYARTFMLNIAAVLAELPQYASAAKNIKTVGQRIGDFLVFLHQNRLTSASRIHIVGHSLGAHAAGYAGTIFQHRTGNLLHRVTGTDPAGPLFITAPYRPLIRPDVASFVDVIHSNRGVFGHPLNLGQVDFNINGGGPVQPGCRLLSEPFCAHNQAVRYYAMSIGNPGLVARQQCTFCRFSSRVIFGQHCLPGSRGVYNINL